MRAVSWATSPIIATWLAAYMGGTAGVSAMLILLAQITLVATFLVRETRDEPLLK
jgi:MHS family shikimate/dehydroshikimate transporter-like MFS transporter